MAIPASSAAPTLKGVGGKKGKKKRDLNETQKPMSAYTLFFRDTRDAIKGQNPRASFGEVSKFVASMWDNLGEEQKQVQTLLELIQSEHTASDSSRPLTEFNHK